MYTEIDRPDFKIITENFIKVKFINFTCKQKKKSSNKNLHTKRVFSYKRDKRKSNFSVSYAEFT